MNRSPLAMRERQRVGGAVGEPADAEPPGIDGDSLERVLQRRVDERDVRAEVPADGVPRGAARIRRQHGDPELLGEREREPHAGSAPARAVQHDRERRPGRRRRVPRHEEHAVAAGRRDSEGARQGRWTRTVETAGPRCALGRLRWSVPAVAHPASAPAPAAAKKRRRDMGLQHRRRLPFICVTPDSLTLRTIVSRRAPAQKPPRVTGLLPARGGGAFTRKIWAADPPARQAHDS